MADKRSQIRAAAEGFLETFITLVHPLRILGGIHSELLIWWTREDAKSHQLVLLPRDHQKSALAAYRVAWEITRNPCIRVLYLSSTANLAEKQLSFIKDILTSDIYRFYWPEMVHVDEGKRKKWTSSEISVDHPLRSVEAIRDPTIFTGGLTTSITGLHCDLAVLDDIVVRENAYTEDGREKVSQQYSLLASIEAADARELIVGTRYHPDDLYNTLMAKKVEFFDAEGDLAGENDLYEVLQRQVEDRGDGTGQFLWPRQQRYDGKYFGFDQDILAKKKAQYIDRTQFHAQYYNNPNAAGEGVITRDNFQYYDRAYLTRTEGKWQYKGRRLNVFASMDFAFSMSKRADYTAIVVVGVDADWNYYVLDIDRFRTNLNSDYYKALLRLHQKWDFRKVRCEVTSGQKAIVESLKRDYIVRDGIALSVEDFNPSRHQGDKEERTNAILQPRYDNRQVWHYQGGHCQTLEEELILAHPPHDDIKDGLASCVDFCRAPTASSGRSRSTGLSDLIHERFGGIR